MNKVRMQCDVIALCPPNAAGEYNLCLVINWTPPRLPIDSRVVYAPRHYLRLLQNLWRSVRMDSMDISLHLHAPEIIEARIWREGVCNKWDENKN